MIPDAPTYDNMKPVLAALELYIFVDTDTGQVCGETIIWTDSLGYPSYETARY